MFSVEVVPSYMTIHCGTLGNVLEYKVHPNRHQYDVHTLTMFMLVRLTRFKTKDTGAQWGSPCT